MLVWINVADHFLSRPTEVVPKQGQCCWCARRGVDHGGVGGPDPLKICKSGQSMFLPPKMSNSTLLLDNSASFTSSRMKGLVSEMEGKTNFSRHLKQFDGLT